VGEPDVAVANSFPENHALFAGFLGRRSRGESSPVSRGRIFILVLGAPAFTYHVEGFGPHVPDGAKLVQLVDDPGVAAWTRLASRSSPISSSAVRALLDAAAPRRRRAPEPRTPLRAPRAIR